MQKHKTLFLVVVLVSGCDQSSTDKQANEISQSMFSINSCELLVAPLADEKQNTTIEKTQAAVINNPESITYIEKLGWSLVEQARSDFDDGYYNLAIHAAKCIRQKAPDSLQAKLLHAYSLHQLHKFKESEILARQLVEERGTWFDQGLLGDVLMEQGRLKESQIAYQAMMDQRPGPQAYSRAAHLRWLTGDLDGAIEMMHTAVTSYGINNSETSSWAQARLGFYLFNAGDIKNADLIVKKIHSIRNDYPPALYLQGRIHLANNAPQAAIEAFEKAIAISPLPEYQWALLETLYLKQGLNSTLNKQAMFKNQAQKTDPRTLALYLATTSQNIDLALQLASMELDKRQDIFTLDAMAWTLYADKQISKATRYIKLALANNTHDARLYYHAAVINQAAGFYEEADKWFNKAYNNQHALLPSEVKDLLSTFAVIAPRHKSLKTNI